MDKVINLSDWRNKPRLPGNDVEEDWGMNLIEDLACAIGNAVVDGMDIDEAAALLKNMIQQAMDAAGITELPDISHIEQEFESLRILRGGKDYE